MTISTDTRARRLPWIGAARPATTADFRAAAEAIGCELHAIEAVWEVEASGRAFRADRSLERRFEPHKMPGATMTWRDSMKIQQSRREQLFRDAYERRPDAALNATSWGGPQIMGRHAITCGFVGTREMVEAMAESETAQVEAFTRFILASGLATALVAQDWPTFATGYNGPGQAARYARRMEAAYRRRSGRASPVVLRIGATGPAVRRLQEALDVAVDGRFGPETDRAVRVFQADQGLTVDGVVGRLTWARLEARRNARPPAQPTRADDVVEAVQKWGGAATAASAATAAVQEVLPEGAYVVLAYGAVALGLIAAAAFLVRRLRGV